MAEEYTPPTTTIKVAYTMYVTSIYDTDKDKAFAEFDRWYEQVTAEARLVGYQEGYDEATWLYVGPKQ